MDRQSESDLIGRCLMDVAEAWDELYSQFWPAVTDCLRRRLCGRPDSNEFAEESAEELWISLWAGDRRKLAQFHGDRGGLAPYLCGIAVNRLRSALRVRRREAGRWTRLPNEVVCPSSTDDSAEAIDLADFLRKLPARLGDICRVELLGEPTPPGYKVPSATALRQAKHRILLQLKAFQSETKGGVDLLTESDDSR